MGHTVFTEKSPHVCTIRTSGSEAGQKEDGVVKDHVYGTYVHGIFDHGRIAEKIIEVLAKRKGVSVDTSGMMDYQAFKETQYDKMADILRKHLDMEQIYRMMEKQEGDR